MNHKGGVLAEEAKLGITGVTSDLLHLTQEHHLGVSHQAETSDLVHLTQEHILGATYKDEEIEMEIRAGRPGFSFQFPAPRNHGRLMLRLTAAPSSMAELLSLYQMPPPPPPPGENGKEHT